MMITISFTRFVQTAVLDILKKRAVRKHYNEIVDSDNIVFLETCAVLNLISYPTFISLNQVFQVNLTRSINADL